MRCASLFGEFEVFRREHMPIQAKSEFHGGVPFDACAIALDQLECQAAINGDGRARDE